MAQKSVLIDDSNNILEELGQVVLNGDLSLGGFGGGPGVITPTALSGNTNDWAPTGKETATIVRITPGGAINLTGIVAPVPPRGKAMLLHNLDAANTITLKHAVTSATANQFFGPNASDALLRPLSSVWIWYDITAAKWLVFGL